jgi:hypothetical protein
MAAFISSNWQGDKTRIPGTGRALTEEQAESVVHQVLSTLPPSVQEEVRNFLARPATSNLTKAARIVLEGAVTGYVSASRKR